MMAEVAVVADMVVAQQERSGAQILVQAAKIAVVFVAVAVEAVLGPQEHSAQWQRLQRLRVLV